MIAMGTPVTPLVVVPQRPQNVVGICRCLQGIPCGESPSEPRVSGVRAIEEADTIPAPANLDEHEMWCALQRHATTCDCDFFEKAGRR